MKRILTLILALTMCIALAACGDNANDKLNDYLFNEDGSPTAKCDEFIEAMEESFAKSSGLTCTSSIKVVDEGFVIDIDINELDDVDDATKTRMQTAYDSMSNTFEGALRDMQSELPEIEYFTINVNEKDGDNLAVITAGK